MSGVTLLAVSYVLLAVFVVAFVVRSVRLARLPVHLRWELAPVPHEKGKGRYGGSYFEEFEWWTKPREKSLMSELVYMLKEIVFLKAVREHNRRLWRFSFPFHFGLYLLVAAAGLLVAIGALGVAGVETGDWRAARTAVLIVAGVGYGLGAIGALGLLGTRAFDRGLRDFTTPAAVLNLLLLLGIFGTGLGGVVATDYYGGMTHLVRALLTANASTTLPVLLGVHVVVTGVFLAYLPFTQMMHFVAKYFTYHRVRWDDEPLVPGSAMEREIQALLSQPVTWAGPHVGADGTKTWVEVATGEVER